MELFHIWVDADSCPAQAKKIILKAARRLLLGVTYAANRDIPFSVKSELFDMHVCDGGEGAADDFIVENAKPDDLVITRDVPLASRLVQKGVTVINDRGVLFDEKNIEKMLKQRELSIQMKSLGISTSASYGGYGPKEVHAFAECFDRVIAQKTSSLSKNL